jgi:hypothetical protein
MYLEYNTNDNPERLYTIRSAAIVLTVGGPFAISTYMTHIITHFLIPVDEGLSQGLVSCLAVSMLLFILVWAYVVLHNRSPSWGWRVMLSMLLISSTISTFVYLFKSEYWKLAPGLWASALFQVSMIYGISGLHRWDGTSSWGRPWHEGRLAQSTLDLSDGMLALCTSVLGFVSNDPSDTSEGSDDSESDNPDDHDITTSCGSIAPPTTSVVVATALVIVGTILTLISRNDPPLILLERTVWRKATAIVSRIFMAAPLLLSDTATDTALMRISFVYYCLYYSMRALGDTTLVRLAAAVSSHHEEEVDQGNTVQDQINILKGIIDEKDAQLQTMEKAVDNQRQDEKARREKASTQLQMELPIRTSHKKDGERSKGDKPPASCPHN